MSQRHATDVVALVFATILTGATVVWLLWLRGQVDDGAWWAGPVVLIVAGAVGLVAAALPSRREDPEPLDGPSSP
jgi:hypothetical protein